MMKNRKLVKGIALAAVITALAAGGTAAYLTDFETATNSFTVGDEREIPGYEALCPHGDLSDHQRMCQCI